MLENLKKPDSSLYRFLGKLFESILATSLDFNPNQDITKNQGFPYDEGVT
ncbi:MAG TPA: hypothetical protein HA258_06505 [Thermoplasmata archaeon]|nr:hypothetical protein [Thermoplasmata archaeon]HIH28587.1 hypothetical protein [Thermoplasmata archaeon]